MAGEHQGDGVDGESLVVDGRAAAMPSRARPEDRGVLWYALVLSAFQSAVTLVGLLKASYLELPILLFLFAPACVSSSRMIFRAYPDALDWWGLRLVLLGMSTSVLASIYFIVGVLLLPSLVYSRPEPALSVVFFGLAVTAPWLGLLGSIVGLRELTWVQRCSGRAG